MLNAIVGSWLLEGMAAYKYNTQVFFLSRIWQWKHKNYGEGKGEWEGIENSYN